MPGADLRQAWTPSFGLMGHESIIMQQSDIGAISNSIKDCLRCGKCKPVCATHVPRANLLYSPRDKILATSLLIEGLAIFAGGQGALFLHNVFACDFDFVCGNGGEWGFECDGRGSAW